MRIPLSDISGVLGASLVQSAHAVVQGYSIDSRTTRAEELFFALRGPNHDGHDHVGDALERGASAAVVDHETAARGSQLVVRDTLAALQELAIWARTRWGGEVAGLTGSAGKTT